MRKFNLLLTAAMLLFWLQATSQPYYFPFYAADSSEPVKLAEECSLKIDKSFILPEDVSSAYKKAYNLQREESMDYVRSLVKYTSYNDELISPYLSSIFSNIIAANPRLRNYRLVVSNWP